MSDRECICYRPGTNDECPVHYPAPPAPTQPPQCTSPWHYYGGAPCVCVERDEALLSHGWYLQEFTDANFIQRYILWHESPDYRHTITPGGLKGREEISAVTATVIKKLAAAELPRPEPEDNPKVGTCVDCRRTIWSREGRITDDSGMYHPICRVVKRAKAAEAKLASIRTIIKS